MKKKSEDKQYYLNILNAWQRQTKCFWIGITHIKDVIMDGKKDKKKRAKVHKRVVRYFNKIGCAKIITDEPITKEYLEHCMINDVKILKKYNNFKLYYHAINIGDFNND